MEYNNLKDYVVGKKDKIARKAKNIAVAGVALATLAGGAMALNGCNNIAEPEDTTMPSETTVYAQTMETTTPSEITEVSTPVESTTEMVGAELSNVQKIESILQGHIDGFQLDSIALRSNSTGEYWIEYRNGADLDALALKNDIDLDTFGRMYAFAKANRKDGMSFDVRLIRDNKLDKWIQKTCVAINNTAMAEEDLQPLLARILLEMDGSTLSYVDDEKGMELFEK